MAETDLTALEQLEQRYPAIPWREPMQVKVMGEPMRFACRVCIALSGLTSAQVRHQFTSEETIRQHIATVHVRRQ